MSKEKGICGNSIWFKYLVLLVQFILLHRPCPIYDQIFGENGRELLVSKRHWTINKTLSSRRLLIKHWAPWDCFASVCVCDTYYAYPIFLLFLFHWVVPFLFSDFIRQRKSWLCGRLHAELPSNCYDCTFRVGYHLLPVSPLLSHISLPNALHFLGQRCSMFRI